MKKISPTILIFSIFLSNIHLDVFAQKNEQSTFVKGPSDSYGDRIRARIKPNIIFNGQNVDAFAEIEVQCAEDGVITNIKTLKTIGSNEWAEATTDAIRRTEIIPRDIDGRIHCPLVISFSTAYKMMRDEMLKRNPSPADNEKLRAENMKRYSEGKPTLSYVSSVNISQLENLGIKKISYCAATYTQAGVFMKGQDQNEFQKKQDLAIKLVGRVITRNSLEFDQSIEISKKWYQEKVDVYKNMIKQRYTKPNGDLDNAFIKLVERDDIECNNFLNSISKR